MGITGRGVIARMKVRALRAMIGLGSMKAFNWRAIALVPFKRRIEIRPLIHDPKLRFWFRDSDNS